MFWYNWYWNSQKAEQQRKTKTKICNQQKQAKSKSPAENSDIW